MASSALRGSLLTGECMFTQVRRGTVLTQSDVWAPPFWDKIEFCKLKIEAKQTRSELKIKIKNKIWDMSYSFEL